MLTLRRTIVVFLLIVPVAAFAKHTRLKIIHWNDFHAQNEPYSIRSGNKVEQIGGFAYFKSVIDSLRRVAVATDDACLALDGGDEFQGTIISSLTKGKSQYELLNTLHPDAVTLGNHEFDYGWKNLKKLLASTARFPVVNANIADQSDRHIAKPYTILRRNGMRIAIIGLTTQSLRTNSLPSSIKGLKIKNYGDVLPELLHELKKKKPTLIMLLTHVGVEEDERLAKEYPEINVIVGGHSHTPLFSPRRIGRTVIVQAGSKGRYVGELDLDVDTDGDSLVSSNGRLVEIVTEHITPDPEAANIVSSLLKKVNEKYRVQIGSLEKDWKNGREYNGNLPTFEAEAFRSELAADIGCINHGGLRKSLIAGPIMMKDIYEINPFQNEMYSVEVTGSALETMLTYMLSGKASESCEFAGIDVVYNAAQQKIISLSISRQAVDPSKKYRIVMNEFIQTHLKGMFGLDESQYSSHPLSVVDTDLIVNAVKRIGTVSGEAIPWLDINGK
ncbi:MAG TPA: bifunctional UDP-sugar hydrolase/5'-nucleotidase [Candidatus Kapabacteria bacterium]|nr:bifunctional UDP-sugar hydrolase/5'-nucleotidase [Candidatus Kapabacteria bacterium]